MAIELTTIPTPQAVTAAAHVYNNTVDPKINPGYIGSAMILAGMSADGLSACRNWLGIRPIGWEQTVRYMGVGGGAIAGGMNFRDFQSARVERIAARNIQNKEGENKAIAKIVGAALGALASTLYALGKAGELGWITLSATTATNLTIACTALWGVGAIISIGLCIYGIYNSQEFQAKWEGFGPQSREGLIQCFSYLLGEVTVSEKEIDDSERLKRKQKAVQTRTSHRAVQLILDEAPGLLNKLRTSTPRAEIEARDFLAKVQFEGYKKRIVYAVGLLVGIISMVGLILGCFASMGVVLPSALFAGAAALNLGTAIANYFAPLNYVRPVAQES